MDAPEPRRPSRPAITALVFAGGVVVLLLAFIAWDVINEDAGTGDLPGAFVAVRSRDNPIVPSTDEFTELVRLTLPPGHYQVFGKVGLHNRDGSASFRAACVLVPSNEDGTPLPSTGEFGADWAMLHLGPFDGPGEHGEFAVSVSQVLTHDGSVVLGCSGSGNESGAFAQYGSIRAIEVSSISTKDMRS